MARERSGHPDSRVRTTLLLVLLAVTVALFLQRHTAAAADMPALGLIPMAPSTMVLPPAPAVPAFTATPEETPEDIGDDASPVEQPPAIRPSRPARRVVQSRPHKQVIMMEVTAYCPCKICCGRDARGITASGKRVSHNGGAFVAADTAVLPFETRISIPGYKGGKVVPVIDRGGDIRGKRLDVFFPTHAQAKKFGRRIVPVTVYEDRDE